MQISNYIQKKFNKLKKTLSNLSDGHNKTVLITADIKCIHLTEAPDNLYEIEVRDGDNTGWIYRDDVDFLSYETLSGHWIMLNFRAVRMLVENLAKVSGKRYCDTPTLHHIRKTDMGVTYFYVSGEDLKVLHDGGI